MLFSALTWDGQRNKDELLSTVVQPLLEIHDTIDLALVPRSSLLLRLARFVHPRGENDLYTAFDDVAVTFGSGHIDSRQ